ncbi:hypothetical protein [Clostridium folliculivorans]|uniref:Uncharacterized protein n=1 Tax=Clostridium folliculivorans TaxID=2886038 RepID=A0A9W5Y0E7_9CLOT|nr:hypothetical protein [Clostridium folliculivorans]GKU24310.1 hypothetical protein CFOLD11_11360 [Clostridium folliculivorans]GKU30416.1 hypothetical protein CFB3_25230 [Clostridium folliculivorans]
MLLKSDKIMKGSITKIIEECWIERNKGNEKYITLEEFRNIHKLIVEYDTKSKEIFIDIVKDIYIKFEDIGQDYKNFIKPINCQGIVLDEDIYAGWGRFNYIYRCKGNRSIWFKDGMIEEYSVYCTIDQNGFQFSLSDLCSLDLFSEEAEEVFSGEFNYDMPIYKLKYVEYTLKRLFYINKAYMKDYYLEYLMDPPDVNILSEFSLKLREEVWDSILELGKRAVDGSDDEKSLFKYCIELMAKVGLDIESRSLIEIFSYIMKSNKNGADITWMIDFLKNVGEKVDENNRKIDENNRKIDENNKEDIIELKPGIGGVNLNLNEIYKRLKKKIKGVSGGQN